MHVHQSLAKLLGGCHDVGDFSENRVIFQVFCYMQNNFICNSVLVMAPTMLSTAWQTAKQDSCTKQRLQNISWWVFKISFILLCWCPFVFASLASRLLKDMLVETQVPSCKSSEAWKIPMMNRSWGQVLLCLEQIVPNHGLSNFFLNTCNNRVVHSRRKN